MSWVDRLHDGVFPARFHTHRSTGCSQVTSHWHLGDSAARLFRRARPQMHAIALLSVLSTPPGDLASLQTELQAIITKHSTFWNASMSFAVYNASVDVAVVAGADDYATGSKLTPQTRIPMGSTTKLFTAVAALRLAENGTISLDEPVAPHVDAYLARPQPCENEPAICVPQCLPTAYCLTKPDAACAGIPKEQQAACSYCLRYLHCHANATAGIPPKATLRELWDAQPAIENVTYRHLLSMRGGIKDYYYDTTQWLYRTVMGSTRDVEPLEFLVHQDHGFLFAPGATGVVPPGVPGAGQTVARGAYSTNGFALVGLALAGALGLNDWAELDQRALAWGDKLPADDDVAFFGRGTCLTYDKVAKQYSGPMPGAGGGHFVEISNHSCLNSYTGGNIGAAPRDVARFTAAVFGPGNALLSPASVAELVTLHPLTDGFAAYGLAYGLGLEAMWTTLPNGTVTAVPDVVCGTLGWALGHAGLDYGSGSTLANYVTGMGLGISFAMTSAYGEGSGLAGMNCSLPFGAQPRAQDFAINDLMNAVASYAGLGAPCPASSYDPPPASSCVDAPTFGTFNGAQLPCASLVASASASSHLTPEQLCDEWLGRTTLDGIVEQERAQGITYVPPAGVDPAKTLGWELCRGTCLAAGTGPCWLRANGTDWCDAPPPPPPPLGARREAPHVAKAAVAARAAEAVAAAVRAQAAA